MSFPHARKPDHELNTPGGAYVRRALPMAGDEKKGPGDTLTAEELQAMPIANRNALVNCGIIELWPESPAAENDDDHVGAPIPRFSFHMGGGMYIVIEGRKITANPVTKDEAAALVAEIAEPDTQENDNGN